MAKPTAKERFWAKVADPDENGCLLWTANVDGGGYGRFKMDKMSKLAHRLAYQWAKGPIPEGLVLDHLCRVRNCVNAMHLEAVAQKVNIDRGEMRARRAELQKSKTHCLHGHEYTPENTLVRSKGRDCRACSYARMRAIRAKKGRE